MTKTNHIMWAMGTDFRYQYANSWFRQMDKFIHYVNQVLKLAIVSEMFPGVLVFLFCIFDDTSWFSSFG